MKRIGGALCLDFTNTVGGRRKGVVLYEHLQQYTDLLKWSLEAGILSHREAQELAIRAGLAPVEANTALERARELRETLYRLFSARANAYPLPRAELESFNLFLSQALTHSRLEASRQEIVWGWQDDESSLDRVLWFVARSAADLLTSDQSARVGECSGDNCSWLFMDTSKNHSRRWCDMGDCGNRAKARRHYARVRKVT